MTSLVDRYVLTALRRVPEQQRTDIDRELRASIADAVDARMDAGAEHDAAVRETLLELGDPDRLADSYADRRTYLIGPELFGLWRRLMTLQYTVVLPIIIAVAVLVEVVDGGTIGSAIGAGINAILSAGVHLAFWTTLVFAVLERTGQGRKELGLVWTPDSLPEYEQGRRVGTQMVVDLVWIVLLIAALVLQQFTFSAEPVLDPANWSFWWPYLIGILLIEAAYTVWVHRMTVRTHVTTVVNAVIGLASAVPMIWLLATDRFFNPDFTFARAGDGSVEDWTSRALVVVIVAVTLWDIVDQGMRAERSRKGLSTKIPGTGVAS